MWIFPSPCLHFNGVNILRLALGAHDEGGGLATAWQWVGARAVAVTRPAGPREGGTSPDFTEEENPERGLEGGDNWQESEVHRRSGGVGKATEMGTRVGEVRRLKDKGLAGPG